jgi:glycolate oxidase FAD binding subunit
MTRVDLSALRRAAGPDALEEHAPLQVDGVAFAATLRPADGEALGRSLAALQGAGVGVVVCGSGSRLGLGNPPRRAELLLSLQRLAGVDVFEPAEGVCHAGAGTPLSVLREKVAAEGWELPLDPPGEGSTLGGVIAAAATGPRAQGFGPVRDAVLGLEVALASGERTRCGGRVVKNVTGYDLARLYTGSLGTLGVVEGAWLRLRPLPERTLVLEAAPDAERACAAGLDAARHATLRAAALVQKGSEAARLVAELAGDAPAVERDAAALASEWGARETQPAALDAVRRLQGTLGSGGLRLRIAALPSRLASTLARLGGAGAQLLVYPGLTLVYAGLPLADGDEAAAARAFALAAETARAAGGSWLVEEAPAWAKRGRDVFGGDARTLALARALKERFDPDGILNAGRFQGFV